ncbi:MAG: hypothetical protein A2X82_13445 [Geobacteraceae bacterium GWC2_55_20]|nr:MAG: hypothetical protein A2X82_13445 [Geobacteraceae bacterium GWC2_55_20]OGU25543.1 MAG: hypothetical protein A2X85_15235 [Geobacteraceae bacterium GWF2_54_21]HBA72167.1 hypothetical protein [Geobacter sp.]HCE68038.1 hypothetical protein [Geobacter sp.]
MKTIICMALLMLLSTQSGAETYSWIDENGTYNYSDDYNSVPKKYRKNVGRRGDDGAAKTPAEAPVPVKSEATAVKPATVADADKPLYDGKTQEEWRKEFDVREAELKRLGLRMEQIQATVKNPSNTERGSLPALIAEYEALRKEYNEKYKRYSDLVESARKAGLVVVMKK